MDFVSQLKEKAKTAGKKSFFAKAKISVLLKPLQKS